LPIENIFSGNPLNRGEIERRDENWITARSKDQTSRFLLVVGSKVIVRDLGQVELLWFDINDIEHLEFKYNPILLGLLNDIAHFVIDVPEKDSQISLYYEKFEGSKLYDARDVALELRSTDSGILAQSLAQLNWHRRNGFCSVCGQKTIVKRGGQKRECLSCSIEHFPRVDPVIIMVVSDGENCLLGQSQGRLASTNRYSALAGFVDQGETVEEAVGREVMEEAGIKVKNVRYYSSQPWPFPSTLMIGCHAEAETTEINMDPEEMTDVKWVDRSEVLLALEGKSETLNLPGPVAIAHNLLKSWATNNFG
tara:strand:+ start:390 stop:1316 length:927 start_codon:yes stop_codon:yes gene_type:complete